MTGLARRVARLEELAEPDRADPFGLAGLTYDELVVAHLDTCRAIAADSVSDDEERASAAKMVAEIESTIRAKAASAHRYKDADTAGMQWRREWREHHGEDYVPPLTPCGEGDLHEPRVMARRAALRARPEIQRLIAEGEKAV